MNTSKLCVGAPMKLLYICTHNRCRSILAEAVTNHLAQGNITAASAGSSPQGSVYPGSLKALARHDIATEGLRSQSWHDFEQYRADAVITLCDQAAAETCPVWFGDAVQAHWGLSDPSKQGDDDAFDRTVDILSRRVRALLEYLQNTQYTDYRKTRAREQLKASLAHIAATITERY